MRGTRLFIFKAPFFLIFLVGKIFEFIGLLGVVRLDKLILIVRIKVEVVK